MKSFILIPARDEKNVNKKIQELKRLKIPFLIICGIKLSNPNVVYREPKGKYDAINYGLKFVPQDTKLIILNDVDTEIKNFNAALRLLKNGFSLVFVKVRVRKGPQLMFYSFLDSLRKRIPIAASGELMLIKYSYLKKMLPLKPCKAEDSFILFKILEMGGKIAFCEECYVITNRTILAAQEETYKRRTVGGIYQALSLTKPPLLVKLFYILLPFASPILLILGKKGYFWVKGIILGFTDYIRGDKTFYWKSNY